MQVHAAVKVLTTALHCLWRGCTKAACHSQVSALAISPSPPLRSAWPSSLGQVGILVQVQLVSAFPKLAAYLSCCAKIT